MAPGTCRHNRTAVSILLSEDPHQAAKLLHLSDAATKPRFLYPAAVRSSKLEQRDPADRLTNLLTKWRKSLPGFDQVQPTFRKSGRIVLPSPRYGKQGQQALFESRGIIRDLTPRSYRYLDKNHFLPCHYLRVFILAWVYFCVDPGNSFTCDPYSCTIRTTGPVQ